MNGSALLDVILGPKPGEGGVGLPRGQFRLEVASHGLRVGVPALLLELGGAAEPQQHPGHHDAHLGDTL